MPTTTLSLPQRESRKLIDPDSDSTVAVVQLNADGRYLISGGSDGKLKLWDWEVGALLKTYRGHSQDVIDASFSNDGAFMGSCGGERGAYIWDVQRDHPIRTLRGHQSRINCIKWSSDDQLLVTASHDSTAKIWDIRSTKSTQPIQTLVSATDAVTSVAISVSNYKIITSSMDGSVRSYDIRTGKLYSDTLSSGISCIALSKDSNLIVAGMLSSQLVVLDAQQGSILKTLTSHINKHSQIKVQFASRDEHIFAGSEDGIARFWDVISGDVIHSLSHSTVRDTSVPAVDYSHERKVAITGGSDGIIKIFTMT